MTEPPTGELVPWSDIFTDYDGAALLLGNGLSRNVWEPFGYRSLYEEAQASGLPPECQTLFAEHGGTNFERVLAALRIAIHIADTLHMDRAPMLATYQEVKRALGRAVRAVHLPREDVPDEPLRRMREVLAHQQVVFTTSYDLLLYWAMGYGGTYAPFVDLFRAEGRCAFDPDWTFVTEDQVPVYYLHGALHLLVEGTGTTVKLTWNDRTLLEQFGEPIPTDPEARPLLITEGSSQDKLAAIQDNRYLEHALDRLRGWKAPLVVFGSGLSEQDDHLVAAISENPDRPVAVSMLQDNRRALVKKQSDIYYRLIAEQLIFFDASTHPLGSPELRVS